MASLLPLPSTSEDLIGGYPPSRGTTAQDGDSRTIASSRISEAGTGYSSQPSSPSGSTRAVYAKSVNAMAEGTMSDVDSRFSPSDVISVTGIYDRRMGDGASVSVRSRGYKDDDEPNAILSPKSSQFQYESKTISSVSVSSSQIQPTTVATLSNRHDNSNMNTKKEGEMSNPPLPENESQINLSTRPQQADEISTSNMTNGISSISQRTSSSAVSIQSSKSEFDQDKESIINSIYKGMNVQKVNQTEENSTLNKTREILPSEAFKSEENKTLEEKKNLLTSSNETESKEKSEIIDPMNQNNAREAHPFHDMENESDSSLIAVTPKRKQSLNDYHNENLMQNSKIQEGISESNKININNNINNDSGISSNKNSNGNDNNDNAPQVATLDSLHDVKPQNQNETHTNQFRNDNPKVIPNTEPDKGVICKCSIL